MQNLIKLLVHMYLLLKISVSGLYHVLNISILTDIKPELLELEPPMSPVAGPSHSADNSMMMYMDQSSVSSHPGTSYQDNQALVAQDSQPQGKYNNLITIPS